MSKDLRELTKQERNVRQTIDGVRMFVESFEETKPVKQIPFRLQGLQEAYEKFQVIRTKIELLTDEVTDTSKPDGDETEEQWTKRFAKQQQKRDDKNAAILFEMEELVYELKAELQSLLQISRPTSPVQSVGPTETHAAPSRVKLPDIRLPTFSGNMKEWVTFRDKFRSLIHDSVQLTAIDKFTYLQSSLSGEALQEISSVDLSAANYEVAWTQLEKRFENKKLIVKAYLDALFAVEGTKKESYEALNRLIGDFDKNLLMLEKIGEKTKNWSTVLVHMLCSRLDTATLRHWEAHHNSKDVPTYENLVKFLRNHCSVLQSVTPNKTNTVEEKRPRFGVSHSAVQSVNKCPFCGEAYHSPFRCVKLLKMRVPERYDAARRCRLCLNCFISGHQARFCSRGTCHHCHQKHHSLLHSDSAQSRSSVPSQQRPPAVNSQQPHSSNNQQQFHTQPTHQNQPTNTNNAQATTSSLLVTHSQNTIHPLSTTDNPCTSNTTVALPVSTQSRTVLLSTAIVCVQDRFGNARLARALLDSCSQFCFMSANFCQKLKLQGTPEHLAVQGIGGSVTVSRKMVNVTVQPRPVKIPPYDCEMNFFVLPKLTTTLPPQRINLRHVEVPKNIILADPEFCEPGQIDLIIGAEHYFDLLTEGRTKITEEGPTLQNTVFGWIVSGRIPDQSVSSPPAVSYSCSVVEIQDQLTKFWELETCRSSSTHSVDETACETIFDQTTVRDDTGRYVVALPKRDFIVSQLGESRNIAMKRFLGLERRFRLNPELKETYGAFIREYQQLGHMKQVADEDDNFPVYYLPHHAVLKPDSTTTKLRVLFDASCRTSTGVSLNDALMVGPVVQDDLLAIIIRFRLHRVAVVADVEKMYRMVMVQPADQRLQRILWRDTPDESVRTYELSTVTYGTASAPYLATKCLQRLSEDGEETHSRAALALKKDFYVDDMLTGADDIEDGKRLAKEMIDLTASGGFTLRKWNSNVPALLADIPENLLDDRVSLELDSSSLKVKTHGLLWEPSTDSFRFHSPSWNTNSVITKRVVLADAARLFDPLGLVGPVVVIAKIFLQELWKQQCGWDDPLPPEMQSFWEEYRRNLSALESLSIPRWGGYRTDLAAVELHGFCDASEKAYGACIYLRCTASDGSVEVRLLTAKSRVAPIDDLKRKKKRQTIPRLELSSALLLSHLYEKVRESIGFAFTAEFYTDSTITKCWLSSLPSRWQIFVANRASEIQHITKGCSWHHIAGTENPADIISRGMTPAQLHYQTSWFEGPLWLRQDRSTWPLDKSTEDVDQSLLEVRRVAALPVVAEAPSEIFGLRSSLFSLVRLVTLVRRFIHNARQHNHEERLTGFLTHTEHDQTMAHLVCLAQKQSFPEEITALQNGNQLKASSTILALNPVLVNGVLRVGGRLSKAMVSTTRKHPIILSHRHPLAKQILASYHLALYHAGLQLLVASVRERYWPTHIRQLGNKVIHECVRCFRSKPQVLEQLMGDLPSERVSPAPPFLKVGVDYCGPFTVVYPYRRAIPQTSYVAIFVCLATKAVHMEITVDLKSESFLAAFKRFVARRGKPALVMCDNAQYFVGAKRELDRLRELFGNEQFQHDVTRAAEEDGIDFQFIPARSPNFGGLWEAAVKSFKHHFKRTIGTTVLEYDEMRTVVAQIEAILNSRPLTPISNDPADYEALTPGHFLIQRPLTAVPEPSLEGIPANRLSIWQKGQDYVQRMWRVWSKQYLSDLHNRNKWTRQRNNISVGTMVLLKDDNLPPLKWRLGRVTQIHAGADGNIRVVDVRTKDGTFRRAISKVCILPIRDNEPAVRLAEN